MSRGGGATDGAVCGALRLTDQSNHAVRVFWELFCWRLVDHHAAACGFVTCQGNIREGGSLPLRGAFVVFTPR